MLDSFTVDQNHGMTWAWECCALIAMFVWGLAIAFAFPLIFNACRAAIYEIFPCTTPSEDGSDETRKRLLVTSVTVVSISVLAAGLLYFLNNGQGIVFNLFGLIACTAGNAITYILPGLIWILLNPKLKTSELAGSYFLVALGVFFSVAGLVANGFKWSELVKAK